MSVRFSRNVRRVLSFCLSDCFSSSTWLHSPDRGVYSSATAQQHEKGRVYFQLVESARLDMATRFVYNTLIFFHRYLYILFCMSSPAATENLVYTFVQQPADTIIILLTQTFPETIDNVLYNATTFHFVSFIYIYIYFFFPFHSFSFVSQRPSLGVCNMYHSGIIDRMSRSWNALFHWSRVTRSIYVFGIHRAYQQRKVYIIRDETLYHVNSQGWVSDKKKTIFKEIYDERSSYLCTMERNPRICKFFD